MRKTPMISDAHRQFCIDVLDFVNKYVAFTSLYYKVQNGECFKEEDEENLRILPKELSEMMKRIEESEKLLGYENVKFPFLEDANFIGFRIEKGELKGNLSLAYAIASPWFCNFAYGKKTSESDCFKFFIAVFITYMKDMLDSNIISQLRSKRIAA